MMGWEDGMARQWTPAASHQCSLLGLNPRSDHWDVLGLLRKKDCCLQFYAQLYDSWITFSKWKMSIQWITQLVSLILIPHWKYPFVYRYSTFEQSWTCFMKCVYSFCQTSLLSGHLPIKKDQTIKCQMDRMSFLNGDPMSTNVSNEKRHVYCHGQTYLLVSDKHHIAGWCSSVAIGPVFLCLIF